MWGRTLKIKHQGDSAFQTTVMYPGDNVEKMMQGVLVFPERFKNDVRFFHCKFLYYLQNVGWYTTVVYNWSLKRTLS